MSFPSALNSVQIVLCLHAFCGYISLKSRVPHICLVHIILPHQLSYSEHITVYIHCSSLRNLIETFSLPPYPSDTNPLPSRPLAIQPSIMATMLFCQPSPTSTDQFLVITIRILAVLGFSYLLKSLYQLLSWLRSPHRSAAGRPNGKHPSSHFSHGMFVQKSTVVKADRALVVVDIVTAEANVGIDPPDDSVSADRWSLELDFDSFGGGDLGIRIPEPAYHPRGRR